MEEAEVAGLECGFKEGRRREGLIPGVCLGDVEMENHLALERIEILYSLDLFSSC